MYLARLKNSLSGTVIWKVDFTKCGLVVDSVTVKAWSNTFENGQVLWKLAGDKKDSPLLVFGGGKCSYFDVKFLIYRQKYIASFIVYPSNTNRNNLGTSV